jgi:phosphoglycerate-specific signal transduction histidine kinase
MEEEPTFTISELISFGYYSRQHPDTVMRKNYLNWKKEKMKKKPFFKPSK